MKIQNDRCHLIFEFPRRSVDGKHLMRVQMKPPLEC